MAANQFGIDLGSMYQTVENVKGARNRNRLSELKVQETEREIRERPERERLAKERESMLSGLRQKAVEGDNSATQQLLAIDPEGGANFIEAVGKMDDRQYKQTQRNVDEIGRLSSYVLQGKSPEEQQRRYNLMINNVSPEAQSKLPQQYDPNFMLMSLAKATSMAKILENPKSIKFGSKDCLYKSGTLIDETNRPVKQTVSGGSGGKGSLKSADESFMYRLSVGLLGGTFDQNGNITDLDPNVRNKIQGIVTESTKLYEEGGLTRSQAVTMSAKKFGLDVPNGSGTMGGTGNSPNTIQNDDPLGIR